MNEPRVPGGAPAEGADAAADDATSSSAPPHALTASLAHARPSLREIFVSFQSRDFRFLCFSGLALGFGQWAQQVALPWLALELTGSAAQIGGVAAIQGGVGIATAPFAGYIADRYPRRLVIIWSNAGSAVQASVLAALAFSGSIQMWQVYVLALAGGALQSMTQPARQAFVYDVTTDETLVNAVTMNSLIQNFARIAGPPIAGAMIGLWGTGAAFAFLALSKVVALVLTLLISKTTRQVRVVGGNPLTLVLEGFRASWEDRRVLGLIVAHSIPTLLVIPYVPYLSVIATKVLHGGPSLFGLLNTMVGSGAVCGLFCLALLGNPRRKGLLMLVCFTIYPACLLVVATSGALIPTLVMLAGVGLVNSVAFALNNTLIQIVARNEVRGRVMGVWQLTSGLQPLGALPMGLMIDRFGIPVGMGSFMVVGIIAFIVFTLAWPAIRRM